MRKCADFEIEKMGDVELAKKEPEKKVLENLATEISDGNNFENKVLQLSKDGVLNYEKSHRGAIQKLPAKTLGALSKKFPPEDFAEIAAKFSPGKFEQIERIFSGTIFKTCTKDSENGFSRIQFPSKEHRHALGFGNIFNLTFRAENPDFAGDFAVIFPPDSPQPQIGKFGTFPYRGKNRVGFGDAVGNYLEAFDDSQIKICETLSEAKTAIENEIGGDLNSFENRAEDPESPEDSRLRGNDSGGGDDKFSLRGDSDLIEPGGDSSLQKSEQKNWKNLADDDFPESKTDYELLEAEEKYFETLTAAEISVAEFIEFYFAGKTPESCAETLADLPAEVVKNFRENAGSDGVAEFLRATGISEIQENQRANLENEIENRLENLTENEKELIELFGGAENFRQILVAVSHHETAYSFDQFSINLYSGCAGFFHFSIGTASDFDVNPFNLKSSVDGVIRLWTREMRTLKRRGVADADLRDAVILAHNHGAGHVLKFKENLNELKAAPGNLDGRGFAKKIKKSREIIFPAT